MKNQQKRKEFLLSAKEEGISVEELIRQNIRGDITEKLMSEFGEEEINGNEATVKIKNSLNGKWGEAYLIKEEGKWKVDMAKPMKMLQNVIKENILDKDLDNYKK